jgi:hypothetical protein
VTIVDLEALVIVVALIVLFERIPMTPANRTLVRIVAIAGLVLWLLRIVAGVTWPAVPTHT